LTLQKPSIIKSSIIGIIGISIILIIFGSGELNFCGIRHITLLEDIKNFEANQDPDFCDQTVTRILEFNEQCEPYIEILDCG
jgi:hypothetical protein